MGGVIWRQGLIVLKHATAVADLDDAGMLRIQERLMEVAPDRNNLAFALKVEYATFERLVDDLQQGKLANARRQPVGANVFTSAYLQKNKTLRLYLELMQPVLVAMEAGWPEFMEAQAPAKQTLGRLKTNPVRLLVSDNVIGKILLTLVHRPINKYARIG